MKKIKTFIYFLFPPLEAYIANKIIKKEENIKRNKKAAKDISTAFFNKTTKKNYTPSFLSQVDNLENSEIHRREIIESKAIALLGSLGVTIAILSFIIAYVIEDDWKFTLNLTSISIYPSLILGFFLLAIIHLIISVWFSLKVIIIEEINLISPEKINFFLNNYSKNYNEKLLSEKLRYVKLNELKILIKGNWLYVSQVLFRRGIIFLAIGVIIFLIYNLNT